MVQKNEGEVGFPCPGGDDGGRAHLSGMLLKREILTELAAHPPIHPEGKPRRGKIIKGRR
jgi:hypothetical protein